MPPKTIQQRFTKGELNPKLLARSDIEMYYSSASKMRNTISLPFGGAQRRGGLKYLATSPNKELIIEPDTITAPNGGTTANINDNDEETYFETNNLSTTDPFVAVKYDLGSSKLITSAVLKKVSLGNLTSASQAAVSANFTIAGFLTFKVSSVNILRAGGGYNPLSPPAVAFSPGTTTATGVANIGGDGRLLSVTITNQGLYTPGQVNSAMTIDPPPAYTSAIFKVQGSNNDVDWDDLSSDFTIDNEIRFYDSPIGASYRYIRIIRVGNDNIGFPFKCAEFNLLQDTGVQSKVRLFSFSFNNSQNYILGVSENKIQIYKNDALVATVSAIGILEVFLPTLKYAQSADTAIFVHPDMIPKKLTRGSSDSEWFLESIVFNSIPKYNFDTTTPSTPAANITPDAEQGVVVMTATAAVFPDDSVVGQYIEGNGGRLKITERQSTFVVIGFTVIPFYTTDTITSGNWTLTTDYENVWSSLRGYPATVTFYEGRLWFGGSLSRPQTLWGSRIGLFFDFDSIGGYDNDAIDVTIDTNELNEIVNISGRRNLQLFTTGSEFIVMQSFSEPITPSNINIKQQTSNGAWAKTKIVDIEGVILFLEKKGKSVIEFVYSDSQGAYSSSNESLLNSHLITHPVDMDAEKNNEAEQSNFLYMVNEDGTLCVGSILLFQNVRGYTLWETDGLFKSITVNPDGTYFIVERNGLLFLEKLDPEKNTDSFKYEELSSPATTMTGLDHLEGEELDVIVDGDYIGKKTVVSGEIALGVTANNTIEAGLSYNNTLLIKSNPIELIEAGTGVSKKKRIAEMTIRTYNSRHIVVNGEEAVLNNSEIEDYTFYGAGDWGEIIYFEITQTKPYPLTILAVQMNVNFER